MWIHIAVVGTNLVHLRGRGGREHGPLARPVALHQSPGANGRLTALDQRIHAIEDGHGLVDLVDFLFGKQRHQHAHGRNHDLGTSLAAPPGRSDELVAQTRAHDRIDEPGVEIDQPLDGHALHRMQPLAQAIATDVLDDLGGVLRIASDERKIGAHGAGHQR